MKTNQHHRNFCGGTLAEALICVGIMQGFVLGLILNLGMTQDGLQEQQFQHMCRYLATDIAQRIQLNPQGWPHYIYRSAEPVLIVPTDCHSRPCSAQHWAIHDLYEWSGLSRVRAPHIELELHTDPQSGQFQFTCQLPRPLNSLVWSRTWNSL